MSEAAWNKAFTHGSRDLQNRLKTVHAKNPKFQAWLKSSGHGSGESAKQASKIVKPSERTKRLQRTSLQAYGSGGLEMGGDGGEDREIRDTIVPLTRDQHSKVQAAARAAKAAAKAAAPAKPKKPLSQSERMSAIARAAKKSRAKDRFDVPTMNPDDMEHDDLIDVHNQLHVRRTYSEQVEESTMINQIDEVTKQEAEDMLGGPVREKPKMPPGKQPAGYRYVRSLARKAMKTGMKKEEVELTEAPKDDREYGYEGDMAMSQLKSVIANAQKLHDMLEPDTDLPEWVQSKITLAEDYVVTAANYMEGQMNEEVEQIDELTAYKRHGISSSPKLKADPFVDKETRLGARKEKTGSETRLPSSDRLTPTGRGSKEDIKRRTGQDVYKTSVYRNKPNLPEEVEQIDEISQELVGNAMRQAGYKRRDHLDAAQAVVDQGGSNIHAIKAHKQAAAAYDAQRQRLRAAYLDREAKKYKKPLVSAGKLKKMKEEVVTEAEGSVPTTPKEKALAAHHGDPNRITFGDVLKARLKSAAAKKMGK